MKAIRLVVGLTLGLALAGCGGSGDGADGDPAAAMVMPVVTGLQLDVALRDIEVAGFADAVDIVGGGTFGVVNESNWTVCEQSPVAGRALASPQLTVDRECDREVAETTMAPTEPAAPEPTAAPVETEPGPEPTDQPVAITSPPAPVEEILTVENSPELAAILAEGDYCADSIHAFATTYQSRTIEFDGHIAFVSLHPGRQTRWDFLISPGEAPGVVGPAFQFRDVGRAELNLTDESMPGLNQGDNLHIVAQVVEYNSASCLFFLDPISTGVR